MQTLKSLFTKKDPTKNPQIESTFDHSKINAADDISQCPFMKNKQQNNKMTEDALQNKQEKCPYGGRTQKKVKKNKDKQVDQSSDQEDIPQGGCPFMGGSQKKKNPDLFQINHGFDQPFISKFNYYLSANKIDFTLLKQKKGHQPVSKSRQIFNTYPIYLQHTLFYNAQDYQKVRGIECCSRFMPYDKLRQKGNKYFNKGKYTEALDYYERALSLFKWLQYYEEEVTIQQSQTHSNIQSQQSIEQEQSFTNENESKNIHINLKNGEEQIEQKNEQIDQMKTKYKEFFVVYNDSNTKLYNGEDMDQKPDIDMRRSLMLQLYLNMAAAYMKLNHYSLALRCIDDCFELSDKVSQIYLRKAQILISDKGYSLQDAQEAKKCMEKAIELKKTQKIFQSNENMLRMVNLHKADEVYNNTLNLVNQKIKEKQAQIKEISQKIYNRAKQIHHVQQRLISQGKTPYERNEEPMQQSKQFKILLRMKQKYTKVIEFYTQAQNNEQIILAKRQIQQLIRVFAEMNSIINVKIEEQTNQLGGIHTQKIQKRIQTIKKSFCEDIYNAGKFNFTVMEWAIKQVIKEEREQENMKKQLQYEKRRINGEQIIEQKEGKYDYLKKASWGLVLIPIAGILINNFLLSG